MDRRNFLAVLGLSAVTGCVDRAASENSINATPTSEPNSSPVATPTATPTQTQTGNSSDGNGGETEEVSNDPDIRRARERLTLAQDYLNRAIKEYVDQTNERNPTFLDTNASVDFQVNDVTGWTSNAQNQIERAELISRGKIPNEIEATRQARDFLHYGALLQYRLSLLYDRLQTVIGTLFDQRFSATTADAEKMSQNLDAASDYLETIMESIPDDTLTLPVELTMEQFEAKMGQWNEELDAFYALQDALIALGDGMAVLDLATTEYFDDDARYTSFGQRFLENAATLLEQSPTPESLEDDLDQLRALASTFAEAAVAMDNAAIARENGNDSLAERLECHARRTVKDYDDWREFDAGQDIFSGANC